VAVGFGVGLAVRVLLRDGACVVRTGVGLAVALGEALALGLAVGLGLALGAALGEPVDGSVASGVTGRSMAVGWAGSESPARRTAPTVPPTASATASTAVAVRPAGEVILRVRVCLPVTGPVLSSADQIGSDHNERTTSDVNVIMMV
jgi:hypothetical protein